MTDKATIKETIKSLDISIRSLKILRNHLAKRPVQVTVSPEQSGTLLAAMNGIADTLETFVASVQGK